MTEAAPIIALRGIEKQYGRNMALDVPELDLKHGEAVLFWGSNASGKSTMLRLLAGVTVPSRGKRLLDPAYGKASRMLLPQSGGLYDDLSICQNLLVLSRLHDREPNFGLFAALLDRNAARYLDDPLRTLSGGMQRIVSIAALLALGPDLLFLDEPFGGLDAKHKQRLTGILADVGRRIPLLAVTEHSPDGADGSWRQLQIVGGRIGETP